MSQQLAETFSVHLKFLVKTEKDKYYIISLIWEIKKKKAKFIEDDLVTRGGAREWGDWKEHQRYKISVIRKIISGDVT